MNSRDGLLFPFPREAEKVDPLSSRSDPDRHVLDRRSFIRISLALHLKGETVTILFLLSDDDAPSEFSVIDETDRPTE